MRETGTDADSDNFDDGEVLFLNEADFAAQTGNFFVLARSPPRRWARSARTATTTITDASGNAEDGDARQFAMLAADIDTNSLEAVPAAYRLLITTGSTVILPDGARVGRRSMIFHHFLQ